MRARLGERLPRFTDRESGLLRGSGDFFGINHYTTHYAADAPGKQPACVGCDPDADAEAAFSLDPAWPRTAMGWAIAPWGLNRLLHWIDRRYGRPEIVITENGCAMEDRLEDGRVDDPGRIDFFKGYLAECSKAIGEGVRLSGYFAWSLLDNFEWASGYGKRFGLHYVDFATRQRLPKSSADWYRRLIAANGF